MSEFQKIVDERVADGWQIKSNTGDKAVLLKGKRVRHWMHFVLSILTSGLWLPVWMIIATLWGQRRITIQEHGNGRITETKRRHAKTSRKRTVRASTNK